MLLSTLKTGDVFCFENGHEIWRVYDPGLNAPAGQVRVGQVSMDRRTLQVQSGVSLEPKYTDDGEVTRLVVSLTVTAIEDGRVWKTPITQTEWRDLALGNGIRDAHGRVWEVTRRDPGGNPDRLYARCTGCDEDRLDWCDGQILDDEASIVVELNQAGVSIV